MTDVKPLSYYEGHTIFRPAYLRGGLSDLARCQKVAAGHGFWVAMLTADESDEEKAGDIIFTTRDSELESMKMRLRVLSAALPMERVKIEHVVFDTNRGDKL